MAGISGKALAFGEPENKNEKFQGQPLDDDLGINWYGFKWRNHDLQIGRFIQIDPLSEKYVYNSTYAFSENKVTAHVELEGLEAVDFSGLGYLTSEAYTRKIGAEKGKSNVDINDLIDKVNRADRNGKLVGAAIGLSFMYPGVASIIMVSELSGVPVNPSPQAMSGTARSGLSTLKTTAQTETSVADEGVDIVVKAKDTWNADQIAQAQAKVDALTNAETVVTKNPVPRDSNLRSKFKAAGGQVSSTQHVDHIVDLQLGGTNAQSNLQALDGSVNSSIGKQLQLRMENLPDNTRVNKVILQLPEKKP